jgi:hypothetical protein
VKGQNVEACHSILKQKDTAVDAFLLVHPLNNTQNPRYKNPRLLRHQLLLYVRAHPRKLAGKHQMLLFDAAAFLLDAPELLS